MDVSAYLERIHIQYLELIKAIEHLYVLQSRILPKVLSKLCDRRHVSSDRQDCTEWQLIGIKAAEWQVLRDEDASKVTWDDVYLDLVTTYEHVVTHSTRAYGGDPTGPACKNVRFQVGGLGALDMDESGEGDTSLLTVSQRKNPLLVSLQLSRTTLSSLSMATLFQAQCAPPSIVPERMRLMLTTVSPFSAEKDQKRVLTTILAVSRIETPSPRRHLMRAT